MAVRSGVSDPTTMAARLRRVAGSLEDADRGVLLEAEAEGEGEGEEEVERANAMLLALCSDFFEAALRAEWVVREDDRRIKLKEVSAGDLRALVAHSEGRGVGWELPDHQGWREEIGTMLRLQGRFAMPQLREACAATLREWAKGGDSWMDAASIAAEHGMWDVVAEALVRASAPPWTSLGEIWSPGGVADVLLMPPRPPQGRDDDMVAPDEAVADVLIRAEFPYHGQRVALASRWWTRRRGFHDDSSIIPEASAVVAALIKTTARHPLWAPEVGGLVLQLDGTHLRLPPSVLAALVRSLVRTTNTGSSQTMPVTVTVTAELRRGMAMIEASLVATAGPGVYQMALVPMACVDGEEQLDVDSAYLSDPVRLSHQGGGGGGGAGGGGALAQVHQSLSPEAAAYHVYLEEGTRLQAWWKRFGGSPGGIHNVCYYRPG